MSLYFCLLIDFMQKERDQLKEQVEECKQAGNQLKTEVTKAQEALKRKEGMELCTQSSFSTIYPCVIIKSFYFWCCMYRIICM